MSRVGDQEAPKWVAYNYRDELVRAMKQIEDLQATQFCKYETCDQEAIYCAGHAGEFVADALNMKQKEIDDLQAVVDAAIVYVHATEQAHHGPYSRAQAKAHRNLIDEVVAYEENQE